MKRNFLIVVDEYYVRDVQIATTVDADQSESENWIDYSGEVVLGVFTESTEEKALEMASQYKCINKSLLKAYPLKTDWGV